MRLPLEKLWPSAYRWLQVLHLGHLLEFKSRIRITLCLSCAISLGYSVAWLTDVLQLSCFTSSPWKAEGLGRWTCVVYLFGGIALAFMFQHSAMALAYYDENGDALREQKERILSEMQKQTADVLSRATGQAQKLCGMLTTDLGDKVNEHVLRMRTILGKISRLEDPEARRIHDDLVTQMGHHLHSLRQPAINHFEKLIKLSGQTRVLKEALRKERHQSMVELLTGRSSGVPRTATMNDEEEEGVLLKIEEFMGASASLHEAFCFGCCHPEPSDQQQELRRTNSVDRAFNVPSAAELQEELRPISLEVRKTSPERVVLQPLRLVLKWFEKIEPRTDGAAGGSRGGATSKSRLYSVSLEEEQAVADQLGAVVGHLKRSPFYRCMLAGILCSMALFAFYAHMLGVCVSVLREGLCPGPMVFACLMALVRKVFGMCAMVCYAVSLGVVLWNVDRLDAVLQVQEDIHQLEDFKRQIDHLNAHDLADEESSVSLIQGVERALADQKRLVAAFFNSAWGESVPLSTFEQLAADLEAVLHPDRGSGGCLMGSYRRLPNQERQQTVYVDAA